MYLLHKLRLKWVHSRTRHAEINLTVDLKITKCSLKGLQAEKPKRILCSKCWWVIDRRKG